ncbi:hypothetical protein SAMN06295879_3096 [Agreia bicolorata]|uniref:Uncharacterized protein n=1 Tax=Agreia bicolorata TaxID=110935 RepID=A0A1T4YG98_9MICO|nr:hypothetical protein [Agreia bicolorata]SKB00852.1 hypothetical protein SAMN06295879_3096 [Agreia bicolorata]
MSSTAPASTHPLPTPLRVVTIVFTVLASIGLVAAVILVIATLVALGDASEEAGWYLGFSVIASVVNVIAAVVALVLGIVGLRRVRNRVSLAALVVGVAVLLVLVAQLIFAAAA